jgi:hypothetical protein
MVLELVKAKEKNKKVGLAKKLDGYHFIVCNTWFLEKVKGLEG